MRPGPKVRASMDTVTASSVSRQDWLLGRLTEADGPTYDQLCREIVADYPEPVPWRARTYGVREVRWALWCGLAVTEPDESVWLTPAGWAAVEDGVP